MKRYTIPLTCVALIFMVAASYSRISAYEVNQTSGGQIIKWISPSTSYYINTSGGPSGTLSAFQAAMQTWTNVTTSSFTFVYGGTSTNTSCDTRDYLNLVCFRSMSSPGILAQNRFWYYVTSGEIVESDIKFNTDYLWATNGSLSAYDVQNVGTHELGHSLSLADLYNLADSEKTMYGYASTGETKKRTLDQDDIDGITYLYPAIGAVRRSVTPPEYYYTLQEAYDACSPGETIQIQALTFYEDLLCDQNVNIRLSGGYDVNYSGNTSYTTINGTLTITNGTVELENIIIQ